MWGGGSGDLSVSPNPKNWVDIWVFHTWSGIRGQDFGTVGDQRLELGLGLENVCIYSIVPCSCRNIFIDIKSYQINEFD